MLLAIVLWKSILKNETAKGAIYFYFIIFFPWNILQRILQQESPKTGQNMLL
jgi:hypothetical protein